MDERTLALKSSLLVIAMRPTGPAFGCFHTNSPRLRQPSVHGSPPNTKNPGNHLGAFTIVNAPSRAFTHRLQRLVIKFPRVIFSHARMESFATHQVKNNVLLLYELFNIYRMI
jgi:hypothetical protein